MGLMSSSDVGEGIFGTGVIRVFFHRFGQEPSRIDELYISQIGLVNSGANSRCNLGGMSPGPGAFVVGIFSRR